MKKGKAAGPTGIVLEVFIADEDYSVEWLTSLCNLIVAQERIPDDWKSSIWQNPGRILTLPYHMGKTFYRLALRPLMGHKVTKIQGWAQGSFVEAERSRRGRLNSRQSRCEVTP